MYSSKPFTHVLLLLFLYALMEDSECQLQIKKEENAQRPVHPRSSIGEETCSTPTAKSGSCVPLISCRNYWSGRSMPDLDNSTCGEGTSSNICCPLAEDEETTVNIKTTTTEKVTSLPTTKDTPTTTVQNETVSSSWRKRFRSFPESCGQSGATFKRIIGGQDSALGAWPWMAVIYLIRRGTKFAECGGVLITASHVLTAAHCVVTSRRGQTFNPRQLLVRLGELDLESDNDGANPIDIKVRTIHRHDKFSLRTFQHDIAILELDQTVDLNGEISTICIPFNALQDDDLAERNAIAAGWGSTRFDGPGSARLQEVSLRIWRNDLCREIFRRDVPITSSNLCAGDGDKDACRGDSGGPLMLADSSTRFYIIGIVSFGKKCAEPGIPGVYCRVTSYLDWIEEKINS